MTTHKYKIIGEWPGMPPWAKVGEVVHFDKPNEWAVMAVPEKYHPYVSHYFEYWVKGVAGVPFMVKIEEINYYKYHNLFEPIFD